MSTPMTDRETISAALAPVAAGRATARFDNGRASIVLDVTGLATSAHAELEADVRKVVEALPGVTEVRVLMTSERLTRKLIAVASGKGGVGKSTVAANLAIALAALGQEGRAGRCRYLWAVAARIMGVEGIRPHPQGQKMIPSRPSSACRCCRWAGWSHRDQAIAWRGPMAGNALGQLIDADWGDAELLVLDLPPGTGDVQLTMIQKHKPAGAVIVSTPQDLALIDARRAIDLFAADGRADHRPDREYGGLCLPALRRSLRSVRQGRRGSRGGGVGHPLSSAACRWRSAIRQASDAGEPPAAGNGPSAETFAGLAAERG
jgi:ATP-binding protein involved in chromosome partitioning